LIVPKGTFAAVDATGVSGKTEVPIPQPVSVRVRAKPAKAASAAREERFIEKSLHVPEAFSLGTSLRLAAEKLVFDSPFRVPECLFGV
jgi:hypothetical protein